MRFRFQYDWSCKLGLTAEQGFLRFEKVLMSLSVLAVADCIVKYFDLVM